ncbi:sulfide/dihydroorotate dehydrogenase-like FAD/NAD-binding protein [Methanimicrococcus blatticola]|uniref:Sulfide dehydrogenase (Flavoprotein) subunit SudB n=1 Tax=Methanimicrococcus blatticola TaxID=91560 RepID=A0A484F322_9EURY|nr:sulfide/dihydroorotate dehydrogenase-like FAD/NAD-binding protein [Methanimicrococcus blatticola]MBZ3936026.1 sulfide/dihydroorotate dehydrogenase-like FAD/NAD-binding protein [Methanimicrococcus blatticola]MCC2509362.1 sulfide/dihydroorotate dehydrogenase-like FAD/NAD-binding protein [Methanimicrococcus blatticola]TDQ68244.1 sulfide dehydrogenase (flavoprotein) subunit SudB [Methanimicrococcus blatticola]
MPFEILEKEEMASGVWKMVIDAPDVAAAAKAGQFVIVRAYDDSERIPLTIADIDRERGTIMMSVQALGKGTKQITKMEVGESLQDFVGPLGTPADVKKIGSVILVGGGVGIAPIYPQIKAYKDAGNRVITIIGARNKDLLMMEKEFEAASDEHYVTTDDGSKGRHGFVTEVVKDLLDKQNAGEYKGERIGRVVVIGPPILMKVATDMMKDYPDVEIVVSINSMMVDGTGMCGGCRVIVGGEVKFACVDGPEFDGRLVDFDTVMNRLMIYKKDELAASQKYDDDCAGGICSKI